MDMNCAGGQMFRLWIATYDKGRPSRWNELPPGATAIEPVEEALYSVTEAALFVEGFNRGMLECDKRLWAVAVPVTVRLEGDARRGMPIVGHAFSASDALAGAPPPVDGTSASGPVHEQTG